MNKLFDYVKVAEPSEILGVAQNTLRKWAAAGLILMQRNPVNGYRLVKRLEKSLQLIGHPVSVRKPR